MLKKKKRKKKRTFLNRLAWGAPGFGLALLMLILAIWAPWHSDLRALQKRAELDDIPQISVSRSRLKVAITLDYVFLPEGHANPVKGREVLSQQLSNIVATGLSPDDVEVIYLPEKPEVNSLAFTLAFKSSQWGAISWVVGGAALLAAMIGLPCATLTKEELIDILKREQ
jgi:hypothetical protein